MGSFFKAVVIFVISPAILLYLHGQRLKGLAKLVVVFPVLN
jgi:hypothetical protein